MQNPAFLGQHVLSYVEYLQGNVAIQPNHYRQELRTFDFHQILADDSSGDIFGLRLMLLLNSLSVLGDDTTHVRIVTRWQIRWFFPFNFEVVRPMTSGS